MKNRHRPSQWRRRRRRFPLVPLLVTLILAIALTLGILVLLNSLSPAEPSGQPSTSSSAPSSRPADSPASTPEEPPEASSGASSEADTAPQPGTAPSGEPHVFPAKAHALLETMTLREKACQLMIVFPEALTGTGKITSAVDSARQGLANYPVGGFLLDKQNLVSKEQVQAMLAGLQAYSKIPLILTCDEEGGRVARVMSTIGTTRFGPMLSYEAQGPAKARSNAATIAADLKSCGFNMDLAPVADVWSNPQNTVIGDRAYSADFTTAAQLIPAAVEGFHQGGVACALKHFPGHGDTSADSHYGSVFVYKTLDEIRTAELLPFQSGIAAGADAVMMGHLILPTVDSQPAPFSYALVTELLRQEMGFDGVVITDGLQMQAMTDHYSSAQIATKAIKAGVDLLLCPSNLEGAVSALTSAVESGEIPEERLNESVLRVLELKLNHGILS